MKCEKCKQNEATFFYEESVNGKTRSLKLCAACAKAMQKAGELSAGYEESPFGYFPSAPDLLGGIFGIPATKKRTSAKTCPLCGADWSAVARAGKMSCPTCYETFAEELSATLRQLHGNVTHTGRAPVKRREVNERREALESKRRELKAAIESENFERAAELRDEIRALEEKKEEN